MEEHQAQKRATILELTQESTTLGASKTIELFPLDALIIFDVHTLCLHLHRALNVVLGLREAMWEELKALCSREFSESDAPMLARSGFLPHEDTPGQLYAKFSRLMEHYKSDMHVRMSIWHSMVHYGWEYPQRDDHSRAEEFEAQRLREDILLARHKAGAENERESPCRSVRILVGAKV
ncbi:uncharacterized protein BXZ73DRAFT_102389 [Epithele typhae]|uniref:uncharacterized protein n=1 Tax=Epithele typhae TaxID=378194 RepID=UPI0020087211|nr:uncharacterized protein BXZ73DRAFT_102389 [Epithele typhae]KAH9928553.1 hypothetical protein BXZ73DRAFT_102389 [Epithele typhae]